MTRTLSRRQSAVLGLVVLVCLAIGFWGLFRVTGKSGLWRDGYELTAFYAEDQQVHVSLRLHYYLNPSGSSGFVNYAASDGTDYDSSRSGKWYCAAPFADQSVRSLLRKLGVVVASASTLPPPERYTLKGPGISGEAPLNDKVSVTGLSADDLIHWTWGRLAPPNVANGYELTHYVQNCVGQMVVEDRADVRVRVVARKV